MSENKNEKFIFNWILINKLAIGTSPIKNENLIYLSNKGVKNIIGLCSTKEASWHKNIYTKFNCERIVLPDSNKGFLPPKEDLMMAFEKLKSFLEKDITFIHCFASIERSPLLCILYIMENYNLVLEDALDYVRNAHNYTNPTNSQLNLINQLFLDATD